MQLNADKELLKAFYNLSDNKDFNRIIEWLKSLKSEFDSNNKLVEEHLLRWNQGYRQLLEAVLGVITAAEEPGARAGAPS